VPLSLGFHEGPSGESPQLSGGWSLESAAHALSEILNATDPNLRPFFRHGGKLIVTSGMNDATVSPDEELDYFQSVIDKVGADRVGASARFFVQPRPGHGVNGLDHIAMLMDWMENHKAPANSIALATRDSSLPMCT
jgi:Tannase and feruloyl esterase